MDNDTSWLPSRISANSSSRLNNHTKTIDSIYVFTPAGNTGKRLLCLIMTILGVVGFFGNCFVFYFLGQKPKRNRAQANRFVANLNLYIRSLSLSDLLCCALSLPLLLIQISFDVFQSGWPCKIVRYVNFVFFAITINILVVISLEKYLSTRKILRTIRTSSMRKMIIGAWVIGSIFMLLPSAAYDGLKVDLNGTHYTIICKNDEQFYPFKITLVVLPLQYVFPGFFVTFVNICLVKTVWDSGRRQVTNMMSSTFQAQLRAKKIRGTTLLIAITFAFIIPFFLFLGNIAYTQMAKPQRDFATDFMIRYGTGCVVFLSPVVNFVIYFAQMKDFRVFLMKTVCRRNIENQQSDIDSGERRLKCPATAITNQNVVGIEGNVVELGRLNSFNSTELTLSQV